MTEQGNQFIGKYNFSRRVVDHRFRFDYNHEINTNPFSLGWRLSIKNLVIGNVVRNIAVWYCGAAIFAGVVINFAAAYYTQNDTEIAHPFRAARHSPASNYIVHYGNQIANKGKWNGNFECWENDPSCGRDFK